MVIRFFSIMFFMSVCAYTYATDYRFQTKINNTTTTDLTLYYPASKNSSADIKGIWCKDGEFDYDSQWNSAGVLNPYDGKGNFGSSIKAGNSVYCLYALKYLNVGSGGNDKVKFYILTTPRMDNPGEKNIAGSFEIYVKDRDQKTLSAQLGNFSPQSNYGLTINATTDSICRGEAFNWGSMCGGKRLIGNIDLSLNNSAQGGISFCVKKPTPCTIDTCNYDVSIVGGNGLVDDAGMLLTYGDYIYPSKISMLLSDTKIGTIKIPSGGDSACYMDDNYYYRFDGQSNNHSFSVYFRSAESSSAGQGTLNYDAQNSKLNSSNKSGFSLSAGKDTIEDDHVDSIPCYGGNCQGMTVTFNPDS